MSLIHWWPLNGDTNNYGTLGAELQATASNTTFVNGKIGKALYKGSLTMTGEQWKKIIGNTISIAMWIYTRDDGSYSAGVPFFGNAYMTEPNNRKFSMFHYPNKTTLHCSWQNDDQSSGESKPTYWGCTYANFFPIGEWVHLCVVQDASTNTITVYRNGEQYSKSVVNDELSSMNFKEAGTAPIRADIDYQHMNDLRIYDHALSQAEVKELSKALVVHYTFDDVLAESTTNIMPINYQKGQFIAGASDNNYDSAGSFTVNTTAHGTYTLSGYYKMGATDTATYPRISLNAKYAESGAVSLKQEWTIHRDGEWHYFSLTGTTDSTKTLQNLSGWLFDYSSPGSSRICYAKDIQLELKDHATPYTPTSRGGMLVNEAGCGGNGTLYNSTLSTDTALGTLSCHTPRINPNSINTMVSPTNAAFVYADVFGYNHTPTEFTVAWWWKVMDWGHGTGPFGLVIGNGDYMDSTLGVHDGSVYVNFAGGNTRVPKGFTGGGTGKWTHFAITFKPGSYTSYINGVSQGTSATDASLTLDPWRYIYLGAGCAGGVLRDGDIYWSDFRYYASCLSPEEIKDLYNCGGRISNLGDALTGSFIEGESATKVNKNHTITTNEIYEQILPDEYQQLEYIESTGSQYINTGVIPTNQAEIQYDHQYIGGSSGWYALFGMDNHNSNAGMGFTVFIVDNEYRPYMGIDWGKNTNAYTSRERELLILNQQGLSINGNKIYNQFAAGTHAALGDVKLFAYWRPANGTGSGSAVRLYECKFLENTQVIRDFIPARCISDNVLGLYDIINNQFYTNAGSENFKAGPTITTGQASMLCNGGLTAREIIEI